MSSMSNVGPCQTSWQGTNYTTVAVNHDFAIDSFLYVSSPGDWISTMTASPSLVKLYVSIFFTSKQDDDTTVVCGMFSDVEVHPTAPIVAHHKESVISSP